MNILQIIKQSKIPLSIRNPLVKGINIIHFVETYVLSTLYGWPQKRMKIIAITGTDGKTTTSYMLHGILKDRGYRVGLISSISAHMGDKKIETGAHVTTPSRSGIQKMLKEMVNENCEYLVLEMTAHGIDQHRLINLHPKVVVFTNITPEHLDYFGTFDNYAQTKAKLIKTTENVLINAQDPTREYLEQECKKEKVSYKTYQITQIESKITKTWEQRFPGEYNKQNVVAAYYVGVILGIKEGQLVESINNLEPPEGRYQILHKTPTIIVDFAHTPNALKALLESTKKHSNVGKVISVFGCAGERDKGKRPEMGKVATEYADIVILTAEDPRTEEIEIICGEIEDGCKSAGGELNKTYYKVHDRKEAIKKAINMASANDWVVISGKGHEKTMCFGHTETPWSDVKAVKSILKERKASYV